RNDKPSERNRYFTVVAPSIQAPWRGRALSSTCCAQILLCSEPSSERHSSDQKIDMPSLVPVGEVKTWPGLAVAISTGNGLLPVPNSKSTRWEIPLLSIIATSNESSINQIPCTGVDIQFGATPSLNVLLKSVSEFTNGISGP